MLNYLHEYGRWLVEKSNLLYLVSRNGQLCDCVVAAVFHPEVCD